MSHVFWAVRVGALAAALALAWLASPSAGPALLAATAALAAAAVAQSPLVLGPRAPGWLPALDPALLVGLAWAGGPSAGQFDLALLVPGCLLAARFGPLQGAAASAGPMLVIAWMLAPPGADPARLGLAVAARAAFFALVPAAAGVAVRSARADAAARARTALGRLRAAQVGEYLSFVIFQLRDYAVTIASLADAIRLAAPQESGPLAEKISKLRRGVKELNDKISRVLGVNAALTTAAPASQGGVDLVELARELAEEARQAFGAEGVELRVSPEGDIPEVRTDRRSVELALLAALQNAFEACAARGGGTIELFLRRGAAPVVELELVDDGGGVPPDAAERLFEPLSCTRAGGSGLGLGLSMARRFVDRFGGDLRVRSRDGMAAALLEVPFEPQLPKIRTSEATWAKRRAEDRQKTPGEEHV